MPTPGAVPTLFALVGIACQTPDWTRPLPESTERPPLTGDSDTLGDSADTVDSSHPEDTAPDAELRVVTAPDWLNLRDQPSPQGAVIRALPCGAEVTLSGDADGGWAPVVAEGQAGWVSEAFLALPESVDNGHCPGPAPYAGEPPGALVTALDIPPYVEQSCTSTTWNGWPFDALRCTYNGGLKVTVADPSAALVAYWITDAAQMIPALAALEERDRGAWKRGLKAIALHTLYQSSRIFPLEGEVDEGYVYDFDRGVTEGCSTGCYCRINSLRRQEWCEYADEVLGIVKEADCLAEYSTTTWTDAWAEHCLDNHRAAWTGIHHHYRAMAYWANKSIAPSVGDPQTADPDKVVDLVEALY